MITCMILLNLFIGVIVNAMMETKQESSKKKTDARAWVRATRLKVKMAKDQLKRAAPTFDSDKRATFDSDNDPMVGKSTKPAKTGVDFTNPISDHPR